METKKPVIIGVIKKGYSFIFFTLSLFSILSSHYSFSQNSKIKCYFNHPVNTAVSTGTNAVYLSGSGSMVDTLINYINRAKTTIDFCVYNFYYTATNDAILNIATAVNNAYTRGVTIRWIGNGSSSNNGYSYLNTNIKTLTSPTTSGYGISHNKFVVFDANSANLNDPIVWTGSFNFTTQQNNSDYNNVVIIQDKPLALAYYNEFNKMWGGTAASPNLANSKFGINKTASAINTFTVNGTAIEVYFSPKDGTASKLQAAINTANNELFFGIYTFTDNTTATVIKNKINAGVTGNGIMDQFSNTYSPYTTLNPVMGANLKVYSNANYLYHNKVMLIDALHAASDPQVCTGSFNWSASADTKNDENMIVIHDATLANEYYQSLCKNFTDVGGTACPAGSGVENYDFGSQQVAVYPNPAQAGLTVKVKNAGEMLNVKITDQLGNIVREATIHFNDELAIDVQDLPQGLYFITVLRGDRSFTQKFLKQ